MSSETAEQREDPGSRSLPAMECEKNSQRVGWAHPRAAPQWATLAASLVVAAFGSACGGKVVFETSGAGGAGGAASSTSSSSKSVTSTGTGAGCPSEDPVSAAPCSTPGLVCPLPNQCCQPSASCTNGHWTISAPDCAQLCLACGPNLDCAANAVCVATSVANTVDYRCEVNPCSGAALSCLCAAPLCDADAATCVSTVGSVVTCETGTKG